MLSLPLIMRESSIVSREWIQKGVPPVCKSTWGRVKGMWFAWDCLLVLHWVITDSSGAFWVKSEMGDSCCLEVWSYDSQIRISVISAAI